MKENRGRTIVLVFVFHTRQTFSMPVTTIIISSGFTANKLD